MKGTLRKYCALILIPLIALSAHADDDDNPCPDPGTGGPCDVWSPVTCSYWYVYNENCNKKYVWYFFSGPSDWKLENLGYAVVTAPADEVDCPSMHASFKRYSWYNVEYREKKGQYTLEPVDECSLPCGLGGADSFGQQETGVRHFSHYTYEFYECLPLTPA